MAELDWPARLGAMLVKREPLQRAADSGHHRYLLPRLALSGHRIEELEEIVGHFPDDFRAFLETADGWPGMFVGYCLFGREELLGSGLGELAESRLRDNELDLSLARIDTVDLRLVGASVDLQTLFCLHRDGRVLWLDDGQVVESFDSFTEFFDSMVLLAERAVAELASTTESRARARSPD